METKSERYKALRLSAIGAIVIMFIVYGSALIITEILDSAVNVKRQTSESENYPSEDKTNRGVNAEVKPTSSPSSVQVLEKEIGNLVLTTQSTTQSEPYNFQISTYVADPAANPGNADQANIFNQSIKSFVDQEKQIFEDNLTAFFGTVDSSTSQLKITSKSIAKKFGDKVELQYEIVTQYAGDTASTSSLKTVEIDL